MSTRALLRMAFALLLVTLMVGCASTASSHTDRRPVISGASNAAEAGFTSIRTLVPDIRLDIRYAGSHNFVGVPIDGYDAPDCLLLRSVADALRRVEQVLRARQQRLLIFDCYRPVRAVAHFMRWAKDPSDQRNKAEFYPTLTSGGTTPCIRNRRRIQFIIF